ncbi:AP2/ERF domain-containing protein PFD0985w-like [Teleopsis dalmanni]|uniref:AP2/ERF domain-containing protein PFD0985w-like n=1 Tax=Teleopsis dalmanni TaxID=139649 RepID=UPI0018CEFAFE|nr:AP2/ERF domain-containing protein PFD0985w-like [Teleopsis dalmanni]XP_037932015.1 AP2/ERF domain-containing protein PFD0985w-like [Teleopsis dalmanni]
MSESVRSGKSSVQSSGTTSTSSKSRCSAVSNSKSDSSSGISSTRSGHTTPLKFTSIVNKVESLISKMHNDKQHGTKRTPNHIDDMHGSSKCCTTTKSNERHRCRITTVGSGADVETNMEMESVICSECKRYDTPHIKQAASLDSLNNLTDIDSFEGNDIIYTDSDDAEIAHITGTTAVQVHRRSDLDQLTDETIREFNEQCSSLSHDMDFENVWSTEEDDHKCCIEPCCMGTTQQETNEQNNVQEVPIKQFNQKNQSTVYKIANSQREREKANNINNSNNVSSSNNHNNINNEHLQKQNISRSNDMQNDFEHIEQENLSNVGNYINGSLNTGKVRRTSIASSGSVGRMETILEEPTECKISVKEILARFENMSEVI